MPVYGSFANTIRNKHLPGLDKAMRETTKDSLDAIQTLVRKHTPVQTGRLRKSVKTSPVVKTSNKSTGEVYSDLYYAAAVEYGTHAHTIHARPGSALNINGHLVSQVHIRAHRGAHMFHHGAKEFEHGPAEFIAAKNLRRYIN